MAKLKAVVSSLDGIDEALHQFYEEGANGSYVLALDDTKGHPLTDGLSSTIGKLKREVAELKGKVSAFGDLDPEAAREALEKVAAGDLPDVDKRVADALERAQAKHKAELDRIAGERDKYKGSLYTTSVEGALDKALADAGVIPELREGAKAMFLRMNPQVKEEGSSFLGVFDRDPDGLPVETPVGDYVKKWAGSDAALPWLPPRGGGGSGAGENGTGNVARGGVRRVSRSDPREYGKVKPADIANGSVVLVD